MSELQSTLEESEKKDYIVGFIISKAPSLPFGYAMVNVGFKEGVEKGKLVIYQNFLVGKVEYVSNEHSLVKFFGNDKENRKLLVGTGRVIRTAEGNGNGSYLVEMPKDAETKSGEVVRLLEFPNYIFGETVLAGTLGNAEKKMFFAESPVNYFEVPFVKILK
jgi:cell shape-determining protein MreC